MTISRKSIYDFSYYDRADKEAFQLSLDLIRANRILISKPLRKLSLMIGNFEKAFWQPDSGEFPAWRTKKGVPGYGIVHHAIHLLISNRYGPRFRNKPQLTILSEALAGAAEYYYDLQYLKNGGSIRNCLGLGKYSSSFKILKRRDFLRRFNFLLKDPFNAFKLTTLDSIKVSNILFNVLKINVTNKGSWTTQQLIKKLNRVEQLPFLHIKDFSNFALYTAAYCGFRSSAADQRDSGDCIKQLKLSRSLTDFMIRMGINDTIASSQ